MGHIESRSGAHAVKAIRCLNDFWSEGCEDLRSPSSGQHSKKGFTSLETICSSSRHLSISCISRNEPGGSQIHVNQVNRSIKMRGPKKNPLASYSNASFLVVLELGVFLIFDSLMYDLNLYHNYGFEYSHDAVEAFSTSFDQLLLHDLTQLHPIQEIHPDLQPSWNTSNIWVGSSPKRKWYTYSL